MADIYGSSERLYLEKYTKKIHYRTLPVLEISLDGATEYIVRSETEYRPDLVSLENYGVIDYDDYITIANKLTDPIKDYKAGKVLYIPTTEAIRAAANETRA
jgi:hypothetical protein